MNKHATRLPALLPLLFVFFTAINTLRGQDVILQGFYWNTHPGDVTNTTTGGIWWDTLATVAPELAAAGFQTVWTPPPTKAFAGVWDMGYGTYDYFDLGNILSKGTTRTRHGSRAELDAMIDALQGNGINVMADVVLNHRGGADAQSMYQEGGNTGYNVFTPPSGRIPSGAAHVHPNNFHPDNNPDYHNAIFFEDLCYFNENDANPPTNLNGTAGSWWFGAPTLMGSMGDSLIMWGRWLVNDVGYDELRLDAVKHIDPWFIKKFLIESKNEIQQPFAVGESFDYGLNNLANYRSAVQDPANSGGVKNAKISMFDFPLRASLKLVLNNTAGTEDLYDVLGNAGLVWGTAGWTPPQPSPMTGFDVVTWLESHDTDRQGYINDTEGCTIPYGAACLKLHTENDHDPVVSDKEDMGYPFLMAAEGRPVVFWKDWYWYGMADDIKWQIALRKATATGASDHIQNMGGFWPTGAPYDGDNHGGNMFALRRNGLTGGVSDGMVLGLNDDDDKEHAVYVNTPFVDKYLKDYSDGYLFQTTQAFGDSRALIKAQKRDYSWWSLTGLYPKPDGTTGSHFNMNATPGGCPHFIALCAADVANLIVNGAPIAVGDEVAVKNAAGQVVGIGRIGQGFKWDGTHDMIIEALGAPSANGLANSEAFRVFVYDASANTEYEIGTVQYAAASTVFNFSPERPNSPNRNGNFSTFPVTTTTQGAFSCQGISRIIAFNTQVAVNQPFCAADQADVAAYNSGWTNGTNGGNGFGAWSLSPASNTGNAGFFIGSSSINTGGESWGMYGNSGQTASATRPFTADVSIGGTVSFNMDNGSINSGGTVGWGLQNSSGNNLLEFYFVGGQAEYKTNDNTGEHGTGIGFTNAGLALAFTLQTATTYQLIVTPSGGSSSTFTGSLKNPAGGQAVNRLRLFNANAGSGSGNDAFFNSLNVCYPASLVINEVDYDQSGTDAEEFVEIKNVSTSTVNLDNYKLELVNGTGGVVYATVDLPNVNLAAGDYYVICNSGSGVANCDLSFAGATNQIQNDVDAMRLVLNNTITVDALSYEGSVTGAVEGSGTSLNDDGGAAAQNLGLSRKPDGNDTNSNNTDFVLACLTPGTANLTNTDTDSDGRPDACDDCPLAVDGISNFNTGTCNCNPGYYPVTEIRNGQTVIIGCQPCPAGSYCPDGINAILCPAGKYSNVTGASECLNCAAGSYNGSPGATECTLCPPGKYSDMTGATECQNCAAGSYQNLSGQTSCTACPPGKYSDMTGATECQNCAAGSYQNLSGQTSCTACPPGKYSDMTGATECQNCAAGSYQNLSGQTSCTACPPGKYSDMTGATECQNCAAGSYQNLSGQTSCTACPPGKYSDMTGATECQNCAAGSYQNLSGQTSCTACPPGKYSNMTGATECQNCAAGSYQNLSGQTSCTACPPGKFSNMTGATECQNCAAGSYQNLSGQTSCTACPPGKYSNMTGATECQNCAAGYYQNLSGQTNCIACAVNTYNPSTGASECQSCGSGFYSPPASIACSVCNVTFTATPTPESCAGALDGAIAVSNVMGGTAPFLYSINNGANYFPTATFTGLAAGMYNVRVKDAYNCESAATQVTVTDGSCPLEFSGTIRWEHDDVSGVQNATVNLTGAGTGNDLTDIDGEYLISIPLVVGNYTLKPVKNINKTNGLSVADAMAIQQHVTLINPITDPYKLIAADVNKSNTINTLDASLINQVLLNNPAANAIFNTSWRFVPASYTLPLPPWGFPEQITMTGVSSNQTGKDFIGVKLGDVTVTYADPANFGGSGGNIEPFTWKVEERVLETQGPLSVLFTTGAFENLAGLQCAFEFDPTRLRFDSFEVLTAIPFKEEDFGRVNADSGEIRLAWSSGPGVDLNPGDEAFRLHFSVLQSGGLLSEALALNDSILPGMSFNTGLEETGVGLIFFNATDVNDPAAAKGPRLLQNRPNPFSDATTIGFVLPAACEAQLRVLDVNGRELLRINNTYPAGNNSETLRLDGLTASGVLTCELVTPFGVATRKMVLVR